MVTRTRRWKGRQWSFIDAYSPRVRALQQEGPQQSIGPLGSRITKNADTEGDNIVGTLMEYEKTRLDLLAGVGDAPVLDQYDPDASHAKAGIVKLKDWVECGVILGWFLVGISSPLLCFNRGKLPQAIRIKSARFLHSQT